jgi:hypothetical protein
VEIASNFELFGSVAADQLILNANVGVHFDEALLNQPLGDEIFELSTWSVTGFPVREFLTRRVSPMVLLGVQPDDLPSLADAHELAGS